MLGFGTWIDYANAQLITLSIRPILISSMDIGASLTSSSSLSQLYFSQYEAIPAIRDLHNVICAAETGCGKTLAYLLPILERLNTYRQTMNPGALSATAPRAVIIVPSRELALQVEVRLLFLDGCER